jgi:hypothetical protein
MPSPATVISVVALFVALGGTGYAATNAVAPHGHAAKAKKTTSVSAAANAAARKVYDQLIKHAHVSYATEAGKAGTANIATDAKEAAYSATAGAATSAGTATNANELGGAPASAYQPAAWWVQVEGDGTIDNQSGGISVVHPDPGQYYVTFPGSVYYHGVSATLQWRQTVGVESGNVLVGLCGDYSTGLDCADKSVDNPNTIYVQTTDNSNTNAADRAFFLVVLQ